MTNGNITKSIVVAGSVLGLIGGVWAMDKHFLPREVHELEMAAMSKAIQGIVDSTRIQSTQNEVFFWMRTEMNLREQLAKNQDDQSISLRLEEAVEKRNEAEQRLKELQRCE